jgi:branched-chain amino acid transport system ATP-binding protein
VSVAPIIAASGLHTYYGPSHVLFGIDIAIARGETIGLMGRNGMGKTTLLRSLLGFTPPRQGEIRVNGKRMTGARPHAIAREGIAFVPEGRGIFAGLSVREHLVMAARSGRDGRRDWTLERVLDLFPRLKERLPQQGALLSGGEQQMLTIGRALLTNPDLLILDEATEGLAPLVAQEIWSILRRLRAGGMAAVIVDKNHTAVTALADRAIVLVKGRIVFAGSSAALEAAPELLARHLGV